MVLSKSKRSFSSVYLVLLALAVAPALSADIILSYGMPSSNINNAAGSGRENGALPQGPQYIGNSFQLSSSATAQDLTIWVILNGLTSGATATDGPTPNQELNSITLYGGDDTTTLTNMGSANLASAQRYYYAGGLNYESAANPGSYSPIYALTFTNLNWILQSNTLYDFVLVGDSINPNTLNLSMSTIDPLNPNISTVNYFSGLPPVFQGGTDNTSFPNFPNYAAINFELTDGVPEPATTALLALGLAGLVWKVRRRKSSDRV